MRTNELIKLGLLNLILGLLTVSPFLPGPSNLIVHIFYSVGQLASIPGLIIIPIGLIWTTRELIKKRRDINYKINIRALILLTLPLTLFLSSTYIAGILRGQARNLAMTRSESLIEVIEKYQKQNGQYPNKLDELKPDFISDIPSPMIMGMKDYHYEKVSDAYNISFSQNVIMYFNFEIVTFDPLDNHKTEGKLPELFETGRAHWRYYIYD